MTVGVPGGCGGEHRMLKRMIVYVDKGATYVGDLEKMKMYVADLSNRLEAIVAELANEAQFVA